MNAAADLRWLMSQFHQDWDIRYKTWEEVVDNFVDATAASRVLGAVAALNDLLTSQADDTQLESAIEDLGCDGYDPNVEDGGYRTWLTAVRDRLLASNNAAVTPSDAQPSPDSPVRQFMGAYLHQDWPEFYGTWERAADEFVADEPEDAQAFPAQAEQLMRDHPEAKDLERVLDALGCSYWPASYDGDYARWLTEVAAYIKQKAAKKAQ